VVELGEKLLLVTVGPLSATIVGTLIIGLFVNWITRRAQDRRTSYELRLELVTQMTEAASAFVYAIAHYRRVRQGLLGDLQLADVSPALHEQYRKTRTAGKVLENRLEAYFKVDTPRSRWHAAIDLLAMRYFHALGDVVAVQLRDSNAGKSHSGLSAQELESETLVRTSYDRAMHEAIAAVLEAPLSNIRE
jgi:hypothetical protein